MAHNALGNHQHVQQGMEVLLENESTPNDQRQAWTVTRVRVVIDIANRLFSRGKELQEDPVKRNLKVTVSALDGDQRKMSVWRQCLEAAVVYYKWALQQDQSYRDQILIRQQIGFCYYRLGFDNDDNDLTPAEQDDLAAEARDHFDFILRLCTMHKTDVNNNPTIRVIRDITRVRLQNLNLEIKRKKKTRTPQNSPS
jgi:hypothetical protein